MNKDFILFQNIDSKIQCQLSDSQAQISVIGTLQEDTDLSVFTWVVKELSRRQASIQINLSDLNNLTDAGAKHWKEALRPVDAEIHYLHLKESFIDFANTMPDLLGQNYQVLSFEAPFFCSSCQREHDILLTLDKDQTPSFQEFKQRPCPTCGTISDFGAFHLTYLRFLRGKNQAVLANNGN